MTSQSDRLPLLHLIAPQKGPNLPGKELSSICSRAPSIPGGYVCTPAHDSIKAPVCVASPPGVASSTAGPFRCISSGILAAAGEALTVEGLSPAPGAASLCKRKGHFPTVTPSPKAASSVPPREAAAGTGKVTRVFWLLALTAEMYWLFVNLGFSSIAELCCEPRGM